MLFGTTFISCSDNPGLKKEIVSEVRSKGLSLNLQKWRKEVLPVDSLKINGELPLQCSKDQLINYLGKPDRIYQIEGNSSASKYKYFYGETIFIVNGNNAIVSSIDFTSTPITLVSSDISFGIDFEAIELQSLFPESCKLIKKSGNLWSGHFQVFASRHVIDDMRWIFYFKQEKLKKVVLYDFYSSS